MVVAVFFLPLSLKVKIFMSTCHDFRIKGNVFIALICYNKIIPGRRTIMQNADIIRAGIVYIEQNLKTDITPEELARQLLHRYD